MCQIDREFAAHCLLAKPYKGFVPTHVGAGLIILVGPNGQILKGVSQKRSGWCNEAWIKVRSQVDEISPHSTERVNLCKK